MGNKDKKAKGENVKDDAKKDKSEHIQDDSAEEGSIGDNGRQKIVESLQVTSQSHANKEKAEEMTDSDITQNTTCNDGATIHSLSRRDDKDKNHSSNFNKEGGSNNCAPCVDTEEDKKLPPDNEDTSENQEDELTPIKHIQERLEDSGANNCPPYVDTEENKKQPPYLNNEDTSEFNENQEDKLTPIKHIQERLEDSGANNCTPYVDTEEKRKQPPYLNNEDTSEFIENQEDELTTNKGIEERLEDRGANNSLSRIDREEDKKQPSDLNKGGGRKSDENQEDVGTNMHPSCVDKEGSLDLNKESTSQRNENQNKESEKRPEEYNTNKPDRKDIKNVMNINIDSPSDNEGNEKRLIEKNNNKIQKLKSTKPSSLRNIGATCYINSAFQGISACDTFVRDINDLFVSNDGSSLNQLHVFKALMDILNGCFTSQMEISSNPIFRDWNKPGQQDSYQVLEYALYQVYNQIRKYMEQVGLIQPRDLNRWLQEKLPMRFLMQYQIVCGCGHVTNSPLQSDLALHVTIPMDQKKSLLNELIDIYLSEDPIDDYECDQPGCSGSGTRRKVRLCRPIPRTICVHLQRTCWDGYSMVKINKEVFFKTDLTLKSQYFYNEPKVGECSATTDDGESSSNRSSDDRDGIISDGSDSVGRVSRADHMNHGERPDDKVGNGDEAHNSTIETENKTLVIMQGNEEEQMFSKESAEFVNSIIIETGPQYAKCKIDETKEDSKFGSRDISVKERNDEGRDGCLMNAREDICFPDKILASMKSPDSEVVENEADAVIKESNSDSIETHMQSEGCNNSQSMENNMNTTMKESDVNSFDKIAEGPKDGLVEKDENYSLVSVIVLFGTVYGGHCICYKRVGDRWFLTDDSHVEEVSEGKVLECQAYILFYEQPYIIDKSREENSH